MIDVSKQILGTWKIEGEPTRLTFKRNNKLDFQVLDSLRKDLMYELRYSEAFEKWQLIAIEIGFAYAFIKSINDKQLIIDNLNVHSEPSRLPNGEFADILDTLTLVKVS